MITRDLLRRTAAAGIAAIAVAVAAVGLASPAVAAVYDHPAAVDPASITVTTQDGTGGVSVGERLRVDASWAVPDDAASGESFGFTLPEEFAGYSGAFDLPAADDPSRTVARCVVSQDEPPVLTCTLTDYVDGRTGVAGHLWFLVTAGTATTEQTVRFTVDGAVVDVELPGSAGIVEPAPESPAPLPTAAYKYG